MTLTVQPGAFTAALELHIAESTTGEHFVVFTTPQRYVELVGTTSLLESTPARTMFETKVCMSESLVGPATPEAELVVTQLRSSEHFEPRTDAYRVASLAAWLT